MLWVRKLLRKPGHRERRGRKSEPPSTERGRFKCLNLVEVRTCLAAGRLPAQPGRSFLKERLRLNSSWAFGRKGMLRQRSSQECLTGLSHTAGHEKKKELRVASQALRFAARPCPSGLILFAAGEKTAAPLMGPGIALPQMSHERPLACAIAAHFHPSLAGVGPCETASCRTLPSRVGSKEPRGPVASSSVRPPWHLKNEAILSQACINDFKSRSALTISGVPRVHKV